MRERAADPRILGGGEFVEEAWEESATPKPRAIADLDRILAEVSESTGASREQILGQSRTRRSAEGQRLFYLRAQEKGDASASLLGRQTGRSQVAVTKAVGQARRPGERKTEKA